MEGQEGHALESCVRKMLKGVRKHEKRAEMVAVLASSEMRGQEGHAMLLKIDDQNTRAALIARAARK